MRISFTRLARPRTGALVLLAAAGGGLTPQGQAADRMSRGFISGAMKRAAFKGGAGQMLTLHTPPRLGVDQVLVAGLGPADKVGVRQLEELGGRLASAPVRGALTVMADAVPGLGVPGTEAAVRMALGASLRGYRFDRYQGRKTKSRSAPAPSRLNLAVAELAAARAAWRPMAAVTEGVNLARDLVNEPANVLTPQEFATRARALGEAGVKVEVLGEAAMAKLGMNALLGVGQGSAKQSQLVVLHWSGAAKTQPPLAFVGKGVCFDTGGISLKPPAGMEDMKGDMGGAACVAGLMCALARRKARVNAVGILGIVENMPGSDAQRPGDIVTSMSGQTIEVLNTDAEGRLVLADALWYAQDRFKPALVIDLATLTGAILVALGKHRAGLFANDDTLAQRVFAAGEAEGDRVWRLPLDKAYDKMINSRFADMQNIGGRYAGSITAAQFLQRFISKGTPWAHLDIAGTAMGSPPTPTNASWASGFGVRLLNRLVADHYESP